MPARAASSRRRTLPSAHEVNVYAENLTERVFRALYTDYRLIAVGGNYIVVPGFCSRHVHLPCFAVWHGRAALHGRGAGLT